MSDRKFSVFAWSGDGYVRQRNRLREDGPTFNKLWRAGYRPAERVVTTDGQVHTARTDLLFVAPLPRRRSPVRRPPAAVASVPRQPVFVPPPAPARPQPGRAALGPSNPIARQALEAARAALKPRALPAPPPLPTVRDIATERMLMTAREPIADANALAIANQDPTFTYYIDPRGRTAAQIAAELAAQNFHGATRAVIVSGDTLNDVRSAQPVIADARDPDSLQRVLDAHESISSLENYRGSAPAIRFVRGPGEQGISYPPLFMGEDGNCAYKIIRERILNPKRKTTGALSQKTLDDRQRQVAQIDALDWTGGFAFATAQAICRSTGFGFRVYDMNGAMMYAIPPKNKKGGTIDIQSYDNHAIAYDNATDPCKPYAPKQVEVLPVTTCMVTLALEKLIDQAPQLVYRSALVGNNRAIVGLRTQQIEYKYADLPLNCFNECDVIVRGLREKYAHNAASRDPAQLEWMRLADRHVATIWFDRPQKGTEIDFNQAYRAAAELKLSDYAPAFQMPFWPTHWVACKPTDHDVAVAIITSKTGFAQLSDLAFDAVAEPRATYMRLQNAGRRVFISPEVKLFVAIGARFTVEVIAWADYSQTIDWQFVNRAEPPRAAVMEAERRLRDDRAFSSASPGVQKKMIEQARDAVVVKAAKNANRHAMGRIIPVPGVQRGTLLMRSVCLPYYRRAMFGTITDVRKFNPDDPRWGDKNCPGPQTPPLFVDYARQCDDAHNQQYHIHAYIVGYLRIAMWDLLAGIPTEDVIKVNIDAVFVKREPAVLPFPVDNSPMGALGAVKMHSGVEPRGSPCRHADKPPLPPPTEEELALLDGEVPPEATMRGPVFTETEFVPTGIFDRERARAAETAQWRDGEWPCVPPINTDAPPQLSCEDDIADTAPPRWLLVGNPGTGKTEKLMRQTGVRVISTHSNEQADRLSERMSEHAGRKVVVKTFHTQYGIDMHDPEYKVTRVPAAPLHQLDEILQVNPRCAASIVRALVAHGKRITLTAGEGQITFSRMLAAELMTGLVDKMGFVRETLTLSYRMEPRLNRLVNSFIKDSETTAPLDRYPPDHASAGRITPAAYATIYRHIASYVAPLVGYGAILVDGTTALELYLDDVAGSSMIAATHAKRELYDDWIALAAPAVRKYHYLTRVCRAGWKKNRGARVVVDGEIPAQLARDIESGACVFSHVSTVSSFQGATIRGKLFVCLDSIFDPDIFTTACSRVLEPSQLVFFEGDPSLCRVITPRHQRPPVDEQPAPPVDEQPAPTQKIVRQLYLPLGKQEPNNPPDWTRENLSEPTDEPVVYKRLADIDEVQRMLLSDDENALLTYCDYPYSHYELFADTDHFWSYFWRQPLEARCYHEVLMTQYRKFVIDFDGAGIDQSCEQSLMKELADVFIATFNDMFADIDRKMYLDELAIINSSGISMISGKYKFSVQIRTARMVSTTRMTKLFAAAFVKAVRPELAPCVDLGVYKRTQNFRIVGSTKRGDNRHSSLLFATEPRKFVGLNDAWMSAFKVPYDRSFIADSLPPEPERPKLTVASDLTAAIIEAAAPFTGGLEYSFDGEHHNFLRQMPSYCKIHGREHTSDNMRAVINDGCVQLLCWCRPPRTVDLFEL